MSSLRLDPEQRFTCASCARCCTRPWEIVVTRAETETYRQKLVGRWFRECADSAEGTERDPFEPIAGTGGFHRIRKREGGACGFLSSANRCRIHEELGARAKPLTCRLFPFSFHAVEDDVAVTASFACPTVVANEGDLIASGKTLDAIKELRTEWFRTYPAPSARLQYVQGRSLSTASLKILRASLLQLLDRQDGLLRMALLLEDLARPRVVRLDDESFAEYLALTAPFAATSDQPMTPRAPSWNARLMRRGFLFLVAATQLQIERQRSAGSSFGMRVRMFRLLAHFHGLAGSVGAFDLRLGRDLAVDLSDPEIQPLVHHYLRSTIQTLGTGVRPVVDELAVAVSSLNAACALAKMKAAAAGSAVDRRVFTEALLEAVDVTHADYGLIARALTFFAAGTESLDAFRAASGPKSEAPEV
ncbi:MAG: YkgJ family cysteine cluster protein [Vicinamibacterales bacterium]